MKSAKTPVKISEMNEKRWGVGSFGEQQPSCGEYLRRPRMTSPLASSNVFPFSRVTSLASSSYNVKMYR